jgi:hypothetical protein
LRKGDFYQLISRQPIASIDPEISEKLDAIFELLTLTTPDQDELSEQSG